MSCNFIRKALNIYTVNKIKSDISDIEKHTKKNIELATKIANISNSNDLNIEPSVTNELELQKKEMHKKLEKITTVYIKRKSNEFTTEKKELRSTIKGYLKTEKKLVTDNEKIIKILNKREGLKKDLEQVENKPEHKKNKLTRKIDECDKKSKELESSILKKADKLKTFITELGDIKTHFVVKENEKYLKSAEYKSLQALVNKNNLSKSSYTESKDRLDKLEEQKNKNSNNLKKIEEELLQEKVNLSKLNLLLIKDKLKTHQKLTKQEEKEIKKSVSEKEKRIDQLHKEQKRLIKEQNRTEQAIDNAHNKQAATGKVIEDTNKKIIAAIRATHDVNKYIAEDTANKEEYNFNNNGDNSNAISHRSSLSGNPYDDDFKDDVEDDGCTPPRSRTHSVQGSTGDNIPDNSEDEKDVTTEIAEETPDREYHNINKNGDNSNASSRRSSLSGNPYDDDFKDDVEDDGCTPPRSRTHSIQGSTGDNIPDNSEDEKDVTTEIAEETPGREYHNINKNGDNSTAASRTSRPNTVQSSTGDNIPDNSEAEAQENGISPATLKAAMKKLKAGSERSTPLTKDDTRVSSNSLHQKKING